MILSEQECRKVFLDWQNSSTALNEDGIIQTAIAAVLDKLTAGVEMPEPEELGEYYDGSLIRGFSYSQLLDYGASQRLAGREQGLEEAKQTLLAEPVELVAKWRVAEVIEQLKGQP